MPLTTMVPFNLGGFRFAHGEFFRRNHRRIHLPVIRAIEDYVPEGQAINQLVQGCCITTPTLPVKEAACITIKSLPDPEVVPFF
jgi:hypothetical protein